MNVRILEQQQAPNQQIVVEEQQVQIFKDFVIFFPCITINLSKQRSQILATQFQKRGGEAFMPDNFNKNNFLSAKDKCLLITSREVKFPFIRQQVEKLGLILADFYQKIISDQWITKSILKKDLLPLQKFQIFANFPIEYFINSKIENDQQVLKQESIYDNNQYFGLKQEQQFNQKLWDWPPLKTEASNKLKQENKIEYGFKEDIIAQKIKLRQRASIGLFAKNKHLLDYNWSPSIIEEVNPVMEKCEKQEQQIMEDSIQTDTLDCIVVGGIRSKKKLIQESIFQGLNLPEQNIKFEETQENSICDRDLRQRREQQEILGQNEVIIECLLQLQQGYELYADKGREIACRRAITYIKDLNFQIKGPEDIFDVKMIGPKLKNAIIEILETGKLKRAETLTQVVRNPAINSFSQLYGMGLKQAAILQQRGINNYEDLSQNTHLLNKTQQNSLKHYEINKLRIPRSECAQIISRIEQCVQDISDLKNIFEVVPCGSYRRGAQDSGDMVILLTRRDGQQCDWFMKRLTRYLEKKLIKEYISSNSNQIGQESYIGICKLGPDSPHRKIEFKYYHKDQFGYAVLYHTGSQLFVDNIRSIADQRGFMFRDSGMFVKGVGSRINLKEEILSCKNEEDVFKLLDLDYVRPEDRNLS